MMIKLIVSDFEHISRLEQALIDANMEYEISLDVFGYGVKCPYLIVDRVVLDEQRAITWIKRNK